MTLKITKNTIGEYCCAFVGILSMNPYFLWPSFSNGIFSYVAYIFYALAILYLISVHSLIVKKRNFIIGLMFIALYMHIYLLGNINSVLSIISGLLSYITLYLIVTCRKDIRYRIFNKFVLLFVISLIPGILYYLLESMGISLSIGTIQSQNQISYANSFEVTGSVGYYKLYIGAVLRINSNTRFSGIYDEAGLVGTVSSLLLIARGFNLRKDKMCRWLLLFNIICLSFAGYLLILGYFFLKWIRKGYWKLCLGLVVGLTCLYMIYNTQANAPIITKLRDRIQFSENGITIVNNRTTSKFDIGYSDFENSSILVKIKGFGRGASAQNRYMNGSSSYKCILYDYGYFGFCLMIMILIYSYNSFKLTHINTRWSQFVLLFIFMVSIYQRPAVMYVYYFIILYGGSAYLNYTFESIKEDKNASN